MLCVFVVAEWILALLKVEMLFLVVLEVFQFILELKMLSRRVCLVELIMVLLHDLIISFKPHKKLSSLG